MGDAPTVVLDARAELGECPVWLARQPATGGIVALRVDVAGVPVALFGA